MAERLTPRTPDPEVQGSNLASHAGVFRGARICGEGRNLVPHVVFLNIHK